MAFIWAEVRPGIASACIESKAVDVIDAKSEVPIELISEEDSAAISKVAVGKTVAGLFEPNVVIDETAICWVPLR